MRRAFFALCLRDWRLQAGMAQPFPAFLLLIALAWGWATHAHPIFFAFSVAWASLLAGAWLGSACWAEDHQAGRWQMLFTLPCPWSMVGLAKLTALWARHALLLGALLFGWLAADGFTALPPHLLAALGHAWALGALAATLAAAASAGRLPAALAFLLALSLGGLLQLTLPAGSLLLAGLWLAASWIHQRLCLALPR